MIQRIQTLYLLFVTIISSFLIYIFIDVAVIVKPGQEIYLTTIDKMSQQEANFYIASLVLLSVSVLLSFITIFLFKKRPLQLKLGKFNILINILLLGIFGYFSLTLSGENSFSKKDILVFVSVITSILFLFLANRAIKKDEDLVKSVDRLR